MQATDKPGLRAALSAQRRARSAPELARSRALIRAHVLDRCTRARWTTVAAYSPLRTEPGSPELLSELAALGVCVLLPVLLADRDLAWTQFGDDRQLPVDAVADADLVIVPALAVAADGTRLGRGGGSYDRALTRVRPGTPLAALVFDGERVAHLPRDPWDVAVTAAVTESGWFTIGDGAGESAAEARR